MKATARQLLSGIRASNFATQTASKTKTDHSKIPTTPQEVKVSKLQNGIVVASLENYSPLSRISISYNTGSRHESADHLGITHCLRAASSLSTQKKSAYLIAKELQQVGGNLTCTTDREHVEYTVDCLRRDASIGLQTLSHIATMPVFKPWEVDSLSHQLKVDLDIFNRNPDAVMLELLHKAAYRDSLGNSLYMPSNRIGSFSHNDLEAFVGARYLSQGAAVTAVGIDHDQLLHMLRKVTFHDGSPAAIKKAKYHGGEARHDVRQPLVHAALVTEGVALPSPDLITAGVLQLAIGTGPFVKYGNNLTSSRISKAVLAATSHPFTVSCINMSYSDSGLFGVHVVASAKDIRKVLTAVAGALGQVTKGGVTDADVQKAKKQLKASLHTYLESAEGQLQAISTQAALARDVIPLSGIDAAIDKVSLDEVNKLAKKVINGKPTLAVVGDLTDTPYVDEIATPRA